MLASRRPLRRQEARLLSFRRTITGASEGILPRGQAEDLSEKLKMHGLGRPTLIPHAADDVDQEPAD